MNKDFLDMQSHYLGMADSIIDQIDDSMPAWQKTQLRTAADVIRRHFAQRMGLSEMCGEEIPLGEWLENWAAGRPPLDRRRSKMAVEKAVAEFSEQLDALAADVPKMEPIQVDDDPEVIDLEAAGVLSAEEV